MIDLNRTLQLVRGALLDPEPTWRNYRPEAGDWQRTALLLTVPLIVASTVLAWLLSMLGSDASPLAQFRPTLASTLLNIVTGAIAAGATAFIFAWFAGIFGGTNSFALGLAATTLAFVPGYVGQALSWLPWIGWLLALGLLIYSLVLLWRIIPLYLDVPDRRRVGHYILSLLSAIIVVYLLSSVVTRMLYGPMPDGPPGGMPSFQ